MKESQEEIARLFVLLEAGTDNEAYLAADKLAKVEGEEVLHRLMELFSSENQDTQYLAARALSKREDNGKVLEAVFELIKTTKNPFLKSVLTESLLGFDCSEYFVNLFKLYLLGSVKVSAMAKEVLDSQEFAITPRVIRKARKHYEHFLHNVKKSDNLIQKKEEVEEMFLTMSALFDGEDLDEEKDS